MTVSPSVLPNFRVSVIKSLFALSRFRVFVISLRVFVVRNPYSARTYAFPGTRRMTPFISRIVSEPITCDACRPLSSMI